MIRTNRSRMVLLLAGALLLGGVLIADTALGQDAGASDDLLVVDDDGADCPDAGYATIQPAVDEALEGQTVRVCSGTYAGSVEISVEDLKLLGQDAILDGEQSRTNGITVDAQSVEVQGFTVLNYKEAGIRVNADDVLLEENTVEQNEGDGVKVRFGAQATVRETTALNNQGTGIVVSGADGSLVVDNRVENNAGLGISGGFISSSEIVVAEVDGSSAFLNKEENAVRWKLAFGDLADEDAKLPVKP